MMPFHDEPSEPPKTARPDSRQSGQVLVLFTIFLAVIMGAAALVLDQGLLRKANQDLWNSLDSGALAGVALLPGDGAGAEALARKYIQLNYPGSIPDDDVDVGFRCLIGSVDGVPRSSDVPAACDPGPGVDWTCDGSVCSAVCEPSAGDVCNVIVVESPALVDFNFAPVLGIFGGSTGDRLAAACIGLCGVAPNEPIDLVLVVDRTTSMTGIDTINARNAADAVRQVYDPRVQWIALSMLGPSRTDHECVTRHDREIGNATTADLRRWVPVGLSGIGAPVNQDFRDADSTLAEGISCFTNSVTNIGRSTDIADPMRMATYELENFGRADVDDAILIMSDGKPNLSTTGTVNYCAEAASAAAAAKAKGIEVFAVAFGLDGANDALCVDQTGPWVGKYATDLLATMATDSTKAGCPGDSNDDGDHYFCVPKTPGASTDLSEIFKRAVISLTGNSRLIKIPA